MPPRYLIPALSIMIAAASTAQAQSPFDIQGTTLIYDSQSRSEPLGIQQGDTRALAGILTDHPQITALHLSSLGGDVHTAYEMADLILGHMLDTHVIDDCESACTILFLAGAQRTMAPDAQLGFHQTSITADDAQTEYDDMKSLMGFDTPFDYAAWLLEDTQEMILNDLYYYNELGLSLGFIIKTLEATPDDMWYPSHSTLKQEGILTR